MHRSDGRAWPIALALLLGATAGAGVFFCLRWRWKSDLITEQPAIMPTYSLPESVENGPEKVHTAVPEKAETTARTVQSARTEEVEDTSDPGAAGGHRPPRGNMTEGSDDLLELLAGEARSAATRLGSEVAALREEAARKDARLERMGRRLAEAMAALDAHAATGMPAPAEAASTDRPVEGRVLDVNEDLGLAVVDQGARHGVRYGLPLVVLRGRRKVASLRVVDVRETVSGAIIEKVADGDGPQAGDRAVLARSTGTEGK